MNASSISPPYIIPLRVGQSEKLPIDTNTLIEIRCDTNDVDIYYTLDGSKPDSFITLTTRRSTIQYKKPFYIPREIANNGKVIINAIAVSRNGVRESIIVTKTFNIKLVPSDHAQSDEYENRYLYELQQERKELMRKIQNEHEQMQQKLSESMHRSTTDSFYQENPLHDTYSKSQIQTKVLRCAHCFTPRTTDLYTRFCTECGLPWQNLNQNQPTNSSIKICTKCKSTIPFNSNTCTVCETSVSYENPPRTNIKTPTRILCPQCKSANPIHLRTCYICESILMPTSIPQIRASVSVPMPSQQTDTMMTCSKCFRLNNTDARFCDWCGAHPERISMPIQCTKCRSNNDSNAKFCSTCGCVMEPPLRYTDTHLRNNLNIPSSSMINDTLTRHSVNPTSTQYRRPYFITKNEAATQTYGIYYPSAKDIDTLMTQNKQLLAEQEFKERPPVLTSVSPGKGYWKQQLDHVCAHLKTYAVNQPDFRSLIGEPRMGKMIHATVHESEYQVTVQAVFRKPENLSQSSFYTDERYQHYPISNERSSPFSSVFNSDDEYTREKSHRTKVKKRPKSAVTTNTDSPNHALMKLFEKKISDNRKKMLHYDDMLEKIKRLIKEKNADVNFRNKDGYTILQLAIRNGYNEYLETLIKDGVAKLDKKGPRGTTALHECCLLGIDGIEPLRILLKHGGDVTWVNDKNETVVDIASKQNCPDLLQVIASHRGQKMVNQQMKHYYDDRARTKITNGHH